MALILSEGQKRAINTRNKNILVSAAAGSGKTFVLTQRVLSRIIEDRWNVDSFLIVTFTRDAAGEMKGRIVKSIEEKLKETASAAIVDEELKLHLEKQLILINKANISTIDAFCSSVIRQNFHKTELDLGYKNPDKIETTALKKQAVGEVLENLLEEDDEDFKVFYNMYSSKYGDDDIIRMIYKLYEFADKLPYPEVWLDECQRDYEEAENFYVSKWGRIYKDNIGTELKAAERNINKAKDYFKYCKTQKMPGCMISALESFEMMKKAYETGDFDSMADVDLSYRIQIYKKETEALDEFVVQNIDDIKSCLRSVKDSLGTVKAKTAVPMEKINIVFEDTKSLAASLIKAAKAFIKRYGQLKIEKQFAEFNDISHCCLNILRNSDGSTTETAKEYQKKFNEIIIDEYQDSNYLQEEILTAVSKCETGENNIFMVGDVKQAIYKFRQTTPKLFKNKYDRYSGEDENEELILLSENYRSRKVVLDACNLVFKQIMDSRLGNVDYTDEVALNPKADFPVPDENINISESAEFLIVNANNAKEEEAKVVAKRIYDMLYTNPLYVYDKEEERYRTVKKRDIVILVKARTNAGLFFEELNSIGISCVFERSNPLFKVTEVKNIISLLRLIDNPLQDIDVVNVLHSPMYALSFDSITRIRLNNRYDYIFDAVREWAEKEDNIASVLRKFIYDIEYYRDFAINNTLTDLISEIYDRSGYFNYAGIQDNGSFRQANLRLFKEKAMEFEAVNSMDLHSFINYIDTDLSDDIDDRDMAGVASVLSENDDVVRIMTIHKSKGLEFPVVFVSQLQSSIGNDEISQNYIFDRELGIGLRYIDEVNRIKYKTPVYNIIADNWKTEERSELLRLLYVAMTRAKEKLIVTGCMNENAKSIAEFEEDGNILLPYSYRSRANNQLFWIIAALQRDYLYDRNEIDFRFINCEDIDNLDMLKGESAVNVLSRINNIEEGEIKGCYSDIIDERLNYVYPDIDETLLPSKISITEIKRKMNIEDEDIKNHYHKDKITGKPKFMKKEEKITSAQLGTLYHTVMEHIDFKNMEISAYSDVILEDLVNRGIITQEESKALSKDKIAAFISSDLFKRIRDSEGIFKEAPFVMTIKASRLREYENTDAEIVVHGIIDLYFKEKDGLVLVDYKTDKIKENVCELASKYKIQLELYKEALEKNTGMKVTECIIYSIDKGECVYVKS